MKNKIQNKTKDQEVIPKITKKQWLISILAILTAVTALMGVDLYLPAIPDMASHFHATKNHLQFTITIYLISIGVAAFFYGPLSDKIGRKPALIIGMVTGLIGCLIIFFSNSINMVIIGRLIQGLGASAGICIATSILVDTFPNKKQMTIVAGNLSMLMSLSPLIAPTIGGYLTHWFGWRSCFALLAILFGILSLLYIIFFKETISNKNPDALKPKIFIANYLLLLKNKTFLFMCICSGIALSLVIAYANIAPFIVMDHFHLSPIEFGWIGMSFAILGGVYLIILSITNFANPLFILIGILISQLAIGLIISNAPAIALPPFKNIAGSASAMYRGSQQIIAFITSAILTLLPWHNSYILSISFIVLGFIGVILLLNLNNNQS